MDIHLYFKNASVKKADSVGVSSPTPTRKTGNVKQQHNLCNECTHLILYNKILESIRRTTIKRSITLTLNMKKKTLNQFESDKELHSYIDNKLLRSNKFKKCNYIIRPEYDKNGRLHYHMIIWSDVEYNICEVVKYWSKTFGFTNRGWNTDIRYYKCFESADSMCDKENCKSKSDKVRACAVHYLFKDYNKTGLWTLYRI